MTARGLKRYLKKRVQVYGALVDGRRGSIIGTGHLVAIDGGAVHLAPSARARAAVAIDLEVVSMIELVPAAHLEVHQGGKVHQMPAPAPTSDEGPGAA